MKKLGVILFLVFFGMRLIAQDYEPKKLSATTEADVLLCFENMDIGVTALTSNMMPGEIEGQDLVIKSLNKKNFKIVDIESFTLNEAIDADGQVIAYMVVEYKIKKDKLKKANNLIKNNEVLFSKLINSLAESDFSNKMNGSKTAPDPEKFKKLRNAFVYNIYIETTEGQKITLQVFVEYFTDASEL